MNFIMIHCAVIISTLPATALFSHLFFLPRDIPVSSNSLSNTMVEFCGCFVPALYFPHTNKRT